MIRIDRSDILWSYAGLLLCSGINLILLPFALRFLPPEQLGLWYTFASFQAFAALLDFGFSVTLCRNFTLAWSGAETLEREGIAKCGSRKTNGRLFADLFQLAGSVYLVLSLCFVLLLLPLGSLYVSSVARGVRGALPAWLLYLAAIGVNLYCSKYSPALRGIGAVKQSQQAAAAGKAAQFLVSALLLLGGSKLVGLSAGYLAGALLTGIVSRRMLRRYCGAGDLLKRGRRFAQQRELFCRLAPNLARQGAISAADFLAGRAGILLVSGYLGLEVSASFGLLQQVTSLITTAANALYNAYLPLFGECRVQGDYKRAKTLLLRSVGVQWCICIAGGTALMLFGGKVLGWAGAGSRLPGLEIVALYLLFSYLLNNHLLFGSYIMTGNRIPMCRAYLVSGGIIVALQWMGLAMFHRGLLAVVLASGCVQLCYNNWKWVWEAWKELQDHRMGGTK